ncbi:MAG: hypothetical protein WC367_10280, partial [Methanoregula sp.]
DEDQNGDGCKGTELTEIHGFYTFLTSDVRLLKYVYLAAFFGQFRTKYMGTAFARPGTMGGDPLPEKITGGG